MDSSANRSPDKKPAATTVVPAISKPANDFPSIAPNRHSAYWLKQDPFFLGWLRLTSYSRSIPDWLRCPHRFGESGSATTIMIHGGGYSEKEYELISRWIQSVSQEMGSLTVYSCSHWGGSFTPNFRPDTPSEGSHILGKLMNGPAWQAEAGSRSPIMFICDGQATNTPTECRRALEITDRLRTAGQPPSHLLAICSEVHAARVLATYGRLAEVSEHSTKVQLFTTKLAVYDQAIRQRVWDEAVRMGKYSAKGDIVRLNGSDMALFEYLASLPRPE